MDTNGSDGAGPWDNTTANWASAGADVLFHVSATTSNSVALATGSNTITVASTAGLAVGQFLSTDRFPVGTKISAIDTGTNVITLDQFSTNTLGVGSGIHFSFNDNVFLGNFSETAGTVTVTGNQAADSLDLNGGDTGTYTLTGGAITVSGRNGSTGTVRVIADATISSALAWKNLQFAVEDKTLTLNGGSPAPAGYETTRAFNGVLSGTTAFIAASSTVAVTGGTFTVSNARMNIGDLTAETGGVQFSAGVINPGGALDIGRDAPGFVHVTGTALLSVTGQLMVGRSGTGSGKLVIDGGTVNANRAGGGNDVEAHIGRDSGVGTLTVKSGIFNVTNAGVAGGILVINSNGTTAGSKGTFNLTGGTTTIEEIRFNGGNNHDGPNSTNGNANMNMTGGTLYLGGTVKLTNTPVANGAGGMVNRNPALAANISLSGGTVGATANWSSNLNMTLGTTNGNVTFKAASAADLPFNISLSGNLSGTGGITKTGSGILTLSGANSHAGDTVISAGTLVLGTSNSSNESSTVTIAATGATLQLDYAGTDTVGHLVIGSNPPLANGVYGAVGSPSPVIGISQITGTGTLTVAGGSSGNYSTWATANGISGEPASGDFDQDGLTNLVEYGLGLNPKVSSQPAGTFAGGTISFTKGADALANGDVGYVIEESTALGNISDPWEAVTPIESSPTAATISYTFPTGLPRDFVRLKVIKLP